MQDKAIKLLFVFGTRPEAIKLAPLVKEFKSRRNTNVKVCYRTTPTNAGSGTGVFGIVPDYDLNIMNLTRLLFDVTADGLKALEPVLSEFQPEMSIRTRRYNPHLLLEHSRRIIKIKSRTLKPVYAATINILPFRKNSTEFWRDILRIFIFHQLFSQ